MTHAVRRAPSKGGPGGQKNFMHAATACKSMPAEQSGCYATISKQSVKAYLSSVNELSKNNNRSHKHYAATLHS